MDRKEEKDRKDIQKMGGWSDSVKPNKGRHRGHKRVMRE